MKIYTLIEVTNVEVQSVKTFNGRDEAFRIFGKIAKENKAEIRHDDEIADAALGTIAMADVGSYSIQLIESELP